MLLFVAFYATFTFSKLFWLRIFLIINNKFNLFTKYLENILQYFSRWACLHFVGNSLGRKVTEKIGGAIIFAPISISFSGEFLFVLGHDDSSMAGRALNRFGIIRPAAPEAILPNYYNTGLKEKLSSYR